MRLRIAAVLERRFLNNKIAPPHFGQLLIEYVESGIGPPHFVEELETAEEGKLWSCIWEAMLYRHLRAHGYEPQGTAKRTGQHGPDFRIEHAGRTIWIEAVAPGPQGIPADYLEPLVRGEIRSKTKPNDERVLRCTSAIADKRLKFDEYRAKGIVGAGDCTVIAVNICQLSEHDIEGTGITQMPLAMEAVFPIGPLAVPITRDGKIDGPMQNTARFSVRKPSGKEIETTAFLDPTFSGVSAVVQAHQRDMHERRLILTTVHNPLATNPLPIGLFDPYKEFVAQPDSYQVRDVRLEARLQELGSSLERRFRAREDRVVRQVTAAESDTFVGDSNKCHENVNRWCFMPEHFAHLRVRGWLISGDCVLDKHSIVDIGGDLIDITPMRDDARRTFLLHDGTEDEFGAMPNQVILTR